MQVNRLFEIVYQLLLKDSVTAAELAERFEVSPRTVYRDIEILSEAGIPVYTSRGRNGGISLVSRFTLDKSLLSEQEQDEILFALQSVGAAKPGTEGELLPRLSGLFQRKSPGWIEADFTEWGSGEEEKRKFAQMKDAILRHVILGFTYYNTKGESSKRMVKPVKLVFKNSWYLQAYCMQKMDYRTFRLSRMEQVYLTEEHYEPCEVQPQAFVNHQNYQAMELQLLFSPRCSYRVLDEFHPSCVQKLEDGSFLVKTSFPAGEWVVGYLLSFGAGVYVVSPKSMQDRIKSEAEKMMNQYKNK